MSSFDWTVENAAGRIGTNSKRLSQAVITSARHVDPGGCSSRREPMPRVVRLQRAGPKLTRRGLVSEELFERRVITLAKALGWRGYHTRKSFGAVMGVSTIDAYGWPDWCFWHPKKRRFMLRELKAQRGRLTKYQTVVLAELLWCGVDAKVWRPSDWPEIEETFAA